MTAAVQLPGYVYVICTLERPAFGRKNSMCMFLILTGAALFTHPFIPSEYPKLRQSRSQNFSKGDETNIGIRSQRLPPPLKWRKRFEK